MALGTCSEHFGSLHSDFSEEEIKSRLVYIESTESFLVYWTRGFGLPACIFGSMKSYY
jgi:hypothetical protein